ARVARQADVAVREWPDARDGPDERALARPRGATEKHGLSTQEREVDVRDQRLAIRQIEVEALHGEMRGAALDPPDAVIARWPAHVRERTLEARETFDHREPRCDFLVRLHEEAQRILNLLERLARLHEAAKTELTPEVAGCRHDRRNDPRPEPIAGREVGHPFLPTHDTPPIAHDVLEASEESA